MRIFTVLLLSLSLVTSSVLTTNADNAEKSIAQKENELLNPFAFFTGKVKQSFTRDQSSIKAKDLSNYIDLENKVINSITDELSWDYENGVLQINTPKTQGVSGFVNEIGRIELDDIIIDSNNEYVSILVISLDNKPIKTSKQILIQAMTEDKPFGWEVEDDTIKSLGKFPQNVRNIDATVTLKKKGNVHSIQALDENGYVKEALTPIRDKGNIKVKLAPDAIYTVVSKANFKGDYIASSNLAEKDTFVWWEGESPLDTNFPRDTQFSGRTFEDTRDQLSGKEWLTNEGPRGEEEPYALYEIEVPAACRPAFLERAP